MHVDLSSNVLLMSNSARNSFQCFLSGLWRYQSNAINNPLIIKGESPTVLQIEETGICYLTSYIELSPTLLPHDIITTYIRFAKIFCIVITFFTTYFRLNFQVILMSLLLDIRVTKIGNEPETFWLQGHS